MTLLRFNSFFLTFKSDYSVISLVCISVFPVFLFPLLLQVEAKANEGALFDIHTNNGLINIFPHVSLIGGCKVHMSGILISEILISEILISEILISEILLIIYCVRYT